MAIIPAEEKVFMVSNSTNTTYSGSAALKAMQQWYTMEDVTNTVRPYKVYTALLTQSGGDNLDDQGSGTVLEGRTYTIGGSSSGDFSNVGAPNNNEGISFVATMTATPNSYGGGSLSFNTGAPVATVLENTIGNIWFTYNDIGNYICYLPIGNISNTICFATNNDSAQNYSIGPLEIGSYVNGQVNIVNWDIFGNSFNGMYQAIEIRVYS